MRPCQAVRFGSFAMMAAVIGLAGCADLQLAGKLNPFDRGEKFREATAESPAVEILALWQPAEGRGLNGMPTRGFAGQVLFFTNGNSAPVKVNGDVRIFLFDDAGTVEEQTKPLHQFDFSPDVWNLHLQKSMLGPSYQVFVPYVRKDPHEARCALSVRLKSGSAPFVYSNLVSVTIPGPARAANKEADPNKPVTADKAASSTDASSDSDKEKATKTAQPEKPTTQTITTKPTNPGASEATFSRTGDARLDLLVQQLVAQTAQPNPAARSRPPQLEPRRFDAVADVEPSKPIALSPVQPSSKGDSAAANAAAGPVRLKRHAIVEDAESFQTVSGTEMDIGTVSLENGENIEAEPVFNARPDAAQSEPISVQ